MDKNIKALKDMFNKIKNKEFSECLRTGITGIGFTFESLIGKEEDNSYLPDFNGIEIKTKLGYSKSPITLFTLVPKKDKISCINEILSKYGYPDKTKGLKNFRGNVYHSYNNIIANKYILKTQIDNDKQILKLIIYDVTFNIIEDKIYWDLEELKNRLFTKLNYLAIIKGYPYILNDKKFFKYTNLNIYKLKNFDSFLNLLKKDKIFIVFNIGMHKSANRFGQICDRGTAFRINLENIDDLFDKID